MGKPKSNHMLFWWHLQEFTGLMWNFLFEFTKYRVQISIVKQTKFSRVVSQINTIQKGKKKKSVLLRNKQTVLLDWREKEVSDEFVVVHIWTSKQTTHLSEESSTEMCCAGTQSLASKAAVEEKRKRVSFISVSFLPLLFCSLYFFYSFFVSEMYSLSVPLYCGKQHNNTSVRLLHSSSRFFQHIVCI